MKLSKANEHAETVRAALNNFSQAVQDARAEGMEVTLQIVDVSTMGMQHGELVMCEVRVHPGKLEAG